MRVLVLSASGYIGLGVARAFRRHGHTVYGLIRDNAKAPLLAASEIIPMVGDASKSFTWTSAAESCDCIVSCVPWDQSLMENIIKAVEDISRKRQVIFINTSGIWVFGEEKQSMVTEMSHRKQMKVTFGRAVLDQRIQDSQRFMGIVIIPGMVYGYNGGSIFGPMVFQAAKEGAVHLPGSAQTRWSMIHVDDLGEMYVLAAEKASLVKGQCFVAVNSVCESVGDIVNAAIQRINPKATVNWVEADNPFFEALATTIQASSRKAESLLGWKAKQPGFVDGMDVFVAAWKGSASHA